MLNQTSSNEHGVEFSLRHSQIIMLNKKLSSGFKFEYKDNLILNQNDSQNKILDLVETKIKKKINPDQIHKIKKYRDSQYDEKIPEKKIRNYLEIPNVNLHIQESLKIIKPISKKQPQKIIEVKNDPFETDNQINTIQSCIKIFGKVRRNSISGPFFTRNHNTPSLFTIENKLFSYSSIEAFKIDFQKTMEYFFNTFSPKSEIYQKANILLNFFDELIEENQIRSQIICKKNKISEKIQDNQIVQRDILTIKEEKIRLRNMILELNSDQLSGLIDLFSFEINPEREEKLVFELDIDSLQIKKLYEIKKYVESCFLQNESNKKSGKVVKKSLSKKRKRKSSSSQSESLKTISVYSDDSESNKIEI